MGTAAFTRRRSAAAALALGCALSSGCWRPGGQSAESAPAERSAATAKPAGGGARVDVVLVTIDTLRADALGFAGNRNVATPTLDRLAAGGTAFTDAHAHNVVTLPSHANILTGLYPFQHGIRDNTGFVLDAATPTLATMLRGAGYATGAFVGAFPLDRRFGLAHGFEVYDDAYPLGSEGARFELAERRGDAVVAAALAWWRSHAGRPRFLWLHVYDPHAAYDPPEPFKSRFSKTPYLGEVSAVDSFLTPLLAPHLDGNEPPALVVVTADHGEALGDHGELTHGLFAYEATLEVPLVVWGQGVPAGRDDRAARHVDIVPTILGRLALAAPNRLPGQSLLEPARAVDTYFEALSTALNRGWAPLRGTLRDRRKYIDLPIAELYSLADDPRETENLAPSRGGETRALRDSLPAASAWPPVGRKAPTGEEAAQLRSLGYAVGNVEPKSSYGPEDDPKSLLAADHALHQVIDLYSRGRYAEAIAAARALIAKHPDLGEAYEHLALALRMLERGDEAVAVLRQGLERLASRRSLRNQLGMTLAELRRSEEAIALLAPLAVDDDPDTLRVYASAISDAGDQPKALAILARAAALAPGDPRILEAQATAELRQDRAALARDLLRQALARNPQLASAWNTLGVALYGTKDPRAAIDAWKKAVALDPKLYDSLYNLGLVAAEIGDVTSARAALRQFVATAPPQRFAEDLAKARAVLAQLGAG
jgi:arylsulfatase A-like enzyme/Flp pilus assembly protein TadD